MKIGPPNKLCYPWLKKRWWEMKKGVRERLIVKRELRASKMKQLDLDLLEQVLSIKWKGNVCTVLWGNTACPRPIEAAPLFFSHEQWQQCLQSSTNDSLCSCSTALIVVQNLYIFQEHLIAASFLRLVHWPLFQPFLLWTPFWSSSIGCWFEKIEVDIELQRGRALSTEICLWLCKWGIQEGMQ